MWKPITCNFVTTYIVFFVIICLDFTWSEILPTGQYHIILSRRHEESLQRCHFPENLHLTLTPCSRKGDNVSLKLQRNGVSQSDATLYSVRRSGVVFLASPEIASKMYIGTSLYQDMLTGTLISIHCPQKSDSIAYEGAIHHMDRHRILSSLNRDTNTIHARPCSVQLKPLSTLSNSFKDYSLSDHFQTIPHKSLSTEIPIVRHIRDVLGSVTSYTIDILVVVDYSVYKRWLRRHEGLPENTQVLYAKREVQKYYTQVIKEVDLRYKRLESADFAIRIRPVGFVIGDSRSVFPWAAGTNNSSNDNLNADQGLKDFRQWLNDTKGLPEHDHAIFFTSLDLYTVKETPRNKIKHTSGLAFIGTMCRPGDSVSIVEEQGGFQSVGTVSHEIGHSLGARHDGEDNFCRSEDRYIMAASGIGPIPADKRLNPWYFSQCSVDYFRGFIASLLANDTMCLQDSGTGRKDAVGQKTSVPEQLYDADEQCRLIWGPGSYLCRGSEFGNASSICTAMYCRDPATDSDCVLHTAARGTSCGNKQWCIAGRCTFSVEAPEITDGCVLGDQPGAAFNGMSCNQLMNQSPSFCYQAKVVARCCSSCRKHFTWRKGCEYGDRIQGCEPWHCGHTINTPDILSNCCGTCNTGDVMLSSDWNMHTTNEAIPKDADTHTDSSADVCTDNLQCKIMIAEYGKFRCYTPEIYNSCCETCSGLVDNFNKECPFGDRSPLLCTKLKNITALSCSKYRSQCCSSCTEEQVASKGVMAIVCNHGLFVLFVIVMFYENVIK